METTKKNSMTNEQTKAKFEELKKRHPNTILFFRQGDFYCAYNEDAQKTASTCGLTLRSDTLFDKSCAFPYHALDTCLPKMIRAGHRIAIVDEDSIKEEVTPQKDTSNEKQEQARQTTAEDDIAQEEQTKVTKREELDLDTIFTELCGTSTEMLDKITKTLDQLHEQYITSRSEYKGGNSTWHTMNDMQTSAKWISQLTYVLKEMSIVSDKMNEYWY